MSESIRINPSNEVITLDNHHRFPFLFFPRIQDSQPLNTSMANMTFAGIYFDSNFTLQDRIDHIVNLGWEYGTVLIDHNGFEKEYIKTYPSFDDASEHAHLMNRRETRGTWYIYRIES